MNDMYHDDMRLTADNSELAAIGKEVKRIYPKRGRGKEQDSQKNRGKSHVRINRVENDEDLFMPKPKSALPKFLVASDADR